ncbi:ArsR/SmtB family transcription factor [Paenibacillus spongiae]|uniref:Metalloregulator ArsR/SmtB family transcription factor n=1 Tax=Paenibacillus spongiae TaxID=2909671 RepID=A0ABY5S930_9BACL|nr:metalloregulator ArsR/SmtB family transcription factor [Paenibacillus spongiae]UVI30427.1 metalloregulator ArsR/SmtB family transcription factor [Paenibacillus spongiae]
MDNLDRVFHALSDPTRREMVQMLTEHEHTVTELAAPFKMSLQSASKHIKVLEEARLLQRTVQGRIHICRLNPGSLAAASAWLRFYEQQWSNHFDVLERELMKLDAGPEGNDAH